MSVTTPSWEYFDIRAEGGENATRKKSEDKAR